MFFVLCCTVQYILLCKMQSDLHDFTHSTWKGHSYNHCASSAFKAWVTVCMIAAAEVNNFPPEDTQRCMNGSFPEEEIMVLLHQCEKYQRNLGWLGKSKLKFPDTQNLTKRLNMHSEFWICFCGAALKWGDVFFFFFRLCKMTCRNECAWTSVFITSWITISLSFLHAWLSHNYHLKWDRSEVNEMVVCTSGHAC